MTTMVRTNQYTLEEQRLACPEIWCSSGAWLVQRDAHRQDLWQVTHPADGGTWTVAATDPVCPRCGATLALSELDALPALGHVLQTI